jgi:Fe-S cluster biogenesis protein NfuA
METRKRRGNMMKEKVEGAIDDIRPDLQADGGGDRKTF